MSRRALISSSEAATLYLGRCLAARIPWGAVVALHGDLGAGKTVLTRGIARGLGVDEPVTSPTFTVVQEYPLGGDRFLFHLDMYRIEGAEAALAFGIEEFLFCPDAVTVVEWPERIAELLQEGAGTVLIEVTHVSPVRRRIQMPARLCAGLPGHPDWEWTDD